MQQNKARATQILDLARSMTDKLVDGFPDDKAVFQPQPWINHVLWQVGHIGRTDDWITGMFDGHESEAPTGYAELFDFGSALVDDYPPFDEVIAFYRTSRQRLLNALDGASDDQLARNVPEWGTDMLGVMFGQAWHEGWHAGQISVIRKSLGLKPIFAAP